MRNSSSGVPPIYYHLNTAGPPQQQLTSMVRPSAHRKGLKHAFTTLYKVKSEKQEVFFFFFAVIGRESLPPREGSRGKMGWGTVLIVGHVQRCPFVSWHLRIKCPPLF